MRKPGERVCVSGRDDNMAVSLVRSFVFLHDLSVNSAEDAFDNRVRAATVDLG